MKEKILGLISLPFVLALALSACNGQADGSTVLRAPEFKLPATGGSVVSLSELRGQTVFLNFWETN
jgi:hypothetical protein